MACRSLTKCDAAAETIRNNNTDVGKVVTMKLDTSSMKSVDSFGRIFLKDFNRLDHLVLNAGIGSFSNLTLSVDGVEEVFHTNHLGHFQLYSALREVLEMTSKKHGVATITHVSSSGHYMANSHQGGVYNSLADFNNPDRVTFAGRYGTTKLYNILFSNEIAARNRMNNIFVLSNAIHPGLVDTNFFQKYIENVQKWSSVAASILTELQALLSRATWTAEEGAKTQLYAAVSSDVQNKKFSKL